MDEPPRCDDDLLARLAQVAAQRFASTDVFLAYAHGSRVDDRPRAQSDLDVGYYLHPEATGHCLPLTQELDLAGALSRALGVEVDLHCVAHWSLEQRGLLLERGIRVYCTDEVARVNLERNLLCQYLDYKPKFAEWRRARFAALAKRTGEG